ncbi:polysaccharide lyase 8 family protein [Nonomuraea sp. NPDC004186]
MALTRRTFLTAATAAATLGLAAPARAEDAFDAARLRWTGMIAGGAFDPGDPDFAAKVAAVDSAAASLRASMSPDPARPSLWPGLPLDDPRTGNFSRAYSQVRGMALGWATPGTRMHRDPAFAADVVSALDFLYEHAYNERLERQNSNWFWWEIGVPRSLTDTCALLHEGIPAGRLDVWFRPLLRWCPDADHRISNATITETGANRTNKAMAVAMRGVLTRDATAIELARGGISDKLGGGRWSLLKLTEGPRDGFYRDGSFIQHEFYPYTGAYGTDHLDGVARLITLYAGSPWDIADPDVVNVFDIVDRSFIPVIYDGLMMDMVRGRQISVQGWRDTDAGQKALEGILILLEGAPRAYAERWRPVIKGWVTRNTVHPFLARAGLPAVRQAKAILGDAAVPTGPRTEGTYVFADMDRVVHRRPTWAYAISMCSERIGAAEGINLENLHGWYTGDGMTYLYTEDLSHWNADHWPTVDPYRMPGTTVDTRRREDIPHGKNYLPPAKWTGGVALDGLGAAGMDLVADGSTLRAKKSWFLLDDSVIALGAGITASDGRRIETVVENRNTEATPAQGRGWAHLGGTGGYVLLDRARAEVLRETRTGTWWDIDQGPTTKGDTTPRTRTYTTILLDHGTNPVDAGYAYAVLPGASAAATARYAAGPAVEVLANTAQAQAVRCGRLRLHAVNFWQAGTVRTPDGPITADGPCSLLIRRHGPTLRVALSDPSRTAQTVSVTLPWPVKSVESGDGTVRLIRTADGPARWAVSVAVGGTRGHTHSAVLRLHT